MGRKNIELCERAYCRRAGPMSCSDMRNVGEGGRGISLSAPSTPSRTSRSRSPMLTASSGTSARASVFGNANREKRCFGQAPARCCR